MQICIIKMHDLTARSDKWFALQEAIDAKPEVVTAVGYELAADANSVTLTTCFIESDNTFGELLCTPTGAIISKTYLDEPTI